MVGVGGDRGLQVQGIGQVDVAVDLDSARDPGVGRAGCRSARPAAAASRSASVWSGSNRALASVINRSSWAGPILCATGATWWSTNAAASGERHTVRSAMNPSRHAGSSPASSRPQQRRSR